MAPVFVFGGIQVDLPLRSPPMFFIDHIHACPSMLLWSRALEAGGRSYVAMAPSARGWRSELRCDDDGMRALELRLAPRLMESQRRVDDHHGRPETDNDKDA